MSWHRHACTICGRGVKEHGVISWHVFSTVPQNEGQRRLKAEYESATTPNPEDGERR